jgi:formate hydrogenlyase transcriptional activator
MTNLQPAGNRQRIILVKQDSPDRQTLEDLLTRNGFEVLSEPNGQALPEFVHGQPVDLILVDLHLPDAQGLEACRRLRQDSLTCEIPLICICDRQDPEARIRGLAAGCVDCVTKPYLAQEVLQRVRTHITLARLQRHLLSPAAAGSDPRQASANTRRHASPAALPANRGSAQDGGGAEISDRLRFEQIISDMSAHFINVPPKRLDREIETALRRVLEFFQVDRAGLLHTMPGRSTWKITHAAYADHATPVPTNTELPRSINPWAYDKLTEKGEVVAYARLDDMPDEAHVDKQTWEEWGIRSNLTIPILRRDAIVHIISINALKKERVWPEVFFPRLQLLGEIFVNALERREIEQALRDSEERLNLAASSAEAGLWVIYADTGLLWATDKLREIFHFSRDEHLTFERFLETVHPEDRERAEATLARCLETRDLSRLDYRIVLPDGRVRWVVARGRSFPATLEHPERVMGVSIDITERKKMETRINEQLAEIQQLKDQLEQENIYLRDEIMLRQGHEGIIARSQPMKQILAQVEQVAATDATVLISGETGTGKELLARRIHSLSRRKERTLVTINCAVLAPTLIESELFGREKGAYTGALTRMAGRFEVADRSTLFLDEIGELPLDLQAKLLRVLEEGRFERLGSTKPLEVDVRIIAATNRDLSQEVAAGRFRSDLFYRLSVFPISIPPLRERAEDIPPLVWMFVKLNEKKLGRRIDRIPRKHMEALKHYGWPGNARELRNIVEHAMITSNGGVLSVSPPDRRPEVGPSTGTLEEVDRRHILSVLAKTGWRITGKNGAAEMLGLKRTTLQAKMKKLGIQRPSK